MSAPADALAATRAALERGDPADAAEQARRALAARETGEAQTLLGLALLRQGRPGEARAALERAAELRGTVPSLLVALGVARLRCGDAPRAEAALAPAAGQLPAGGERFEALGFLAQARYGRQDYDGAQAALDAAWADGADSPKMLAMQGHVLADRGEPQAAHRWYSRAREAAPADFGIAWAYALNLAEIDGPGAAAQAWEAAVALRPDHADARYLGADKLYHNGELGRSAGHLLVLLDRRPDYANAWLRLAMVRVSQGFPDASRYCLARGIQLLDRSSRPYEAISFGLHYLRNCDPEILLAVQQHWLPRFMPEASSYARTPGHADPDRPLKVGFLSPALCNHPTGYFSYAGVAGLSRYGFEVHALDLNAGGEADEMKAALRAGAQVWHDLEGYHARLDDLLDYLRAQAFDIIIDMGGFMDKGALPVLHARAAPLQMKWVGGQFSSTGAAAMDYFISDPVGTPDALAGDFTETLIRLGGGYTAYAPPRAWPTIFRPPHERLGRVTLGCFNKSAKICADTIALWAEILRARPEAQLYLRTGGLDDPATAAAWRARFRALGIGEDRIRLGGRISHLELLNAYNDVDIALDPLAYSGGLTTCEALYMGVPVVTCPGRLFTARHAACRLAAAGLEHWIAADETQYRDTVLALMDDSAALAYWRQELPARVGDSPLLDGNRNLAELALGLRLAWRRYAHDRESRVPIDVSVTPEGQVAPLAPAESEPPQPDPDAITAAALRQEAQRAVAAGEGRRADRLIQYLLVVAPWDREGTRLADRQGCNTVPPEANTWPEL